MSDPRIVCGARCTWWDSIDKIAKTPPKGPGHVQLPCCPHCGGELFEYENEAAWWAAVDSYAAEPTAPSYYRKMVEFGRGKCFRTFAQQKAAYLAEEQKP